jgi:hypothetical protein
LVIFEIATGAVSSRIELFEPPAPVLQCLNDGRSMSDVDFRTSGNLFLMDLRWLPDSSGSLTAQSYLGEGAQGGGSVCIFNYSRMCHYDVRVND